MNMLISNEFGQYFARLPLKKAATIVHGDSLEIDWQGLLNPINTIDVVAKHTNIYLVKESEAEYRQVNVQTESYSINYGKPEQSEAVKFDYILGNPPFIGSKIMTQNQRNQIVKQFDNAEGSGVLDYVTAWYIKAAKYIEHTQTKVAFVSTNSIVQGEQTSILWGNMLRKYGIKIHFAHRTFKWSNEAKGNAAVYCVIVGFAHFDTQNKSIFEYNDIRGEAHELKAKNINPYLVDAKDVFIGKRRNPICQVPEISFGSMPNDGGNLLFTDEEKAAFVAQEPKAAQYFKPFIGAYEFLNGKKKWCLWFLGTLAPNELSALPTTYKRIQEVGKLRSKSTRSSTKKLAAFPSLFGEIRQPESDYILIPRVSSEYRKIIPMGFFGPDNIVGDTCLSVANATRYHLGILQSAMHMAWVGAVCGRLENRFRYSNEIVYNNFPWPENPTDKQIKAIETAVGKVLEARLQFENSSLAELYDPFKMPPILVKAHTELDKAVDLAYRPQVFTSEANRLVFLFELYEKFTADLFTALKPKKSQQSEG
jgi:hypothetical protein